MNPARKSNSSTFQVWLLAGALAAVWVDLPRAQGADRTLYVSPQAADGGNGAPGRPFRTLVQARDALRAMRRAGHSTSELPTTIELAPGDYSIQASFELAEEDSGTADAPIIYSAKTPGTARIQGGSSLAAELFLPVREPSIRERLAPEVRDKVKVCDLAKTVPGPIAQLKTAYHGVPSGPWLYFDGRPMTLARWPNLDAPGKGWAEFSKAVDTGLPEPEAMTPELRKAHPGSFVFDDPRPGRWKLQDGVWLLGYWTHDWSDEVLRIGAYDPEKKVITLAAPHTYGIAAGTWGAAKRRFFALNVLEELDRPGEWYLDRTGKQLYFYPPADLQGAQIALATLTDPMVRVHKAKHLKFIGLSFEYSQGDGLALQNAEGIEIAGCRIANLAGTGITVDGRANTIRSCDLFNLGKGGINLTGGDRRLLVRAGNEAVNNHIHHYGLFQRTYAAGINANGCGQTARNNCIHDAPHNAVLYGGNEHLFECNEIYRVVMETGDAGAFYTGRDWTSQGNVLRNNYIHELGSGDEGHVNTMGVYLDDCDSGDTLEGNIFYRAGRAMMIGGGRDNIVVGNLVVDCPIGLHLDSRGMTWKQWNSPEDPSWHLEAKAQRLDYTQPPWSERYPRLASIMQDHPREPLGNVFQRNVFIDCTKEVCSFDGNVKKLLPQLDIADNLVVNSDGAKSVVLAPNFKGFRNLSGSKSKPVTLGFMKPGEGEFALPKAGIAIEQVSSFKPIPAGRIGLQLDQYRRGLPSRSE